jgi:hypothetical protein
VKKKTPNNKQDPNSKFQYPDLLLLLLLLLYPQGSMKVIRLSLKHIHHIVFSPIFSAAKICKIQTYPKKFPKTPKSKRKNKAPIPNKSPPPSLWQAPQIQKPDKGFKFRATEFENRSRTSLLLLLSSELLYKGKFASTQNPTRVKTREEETSNSNNNNNNNKYNKTTQSRKSSKCSCFSLPQTS